MSAHNPGRVGFTSSEERRAHEGYLGADPNGTRTLWCRVLLYIRGYQYGIDVCPSEVLDVCRGLWLAGGIEAISVAPDYLSPVAWRYVDREANLRARTVGGYSNG